MWIYGVIDRAGLSSFPWMIKKVFFLRKRTAEEKKSELPELKFDSLENKNVLTSGEFFPTRTEAFMERLVQEKANVRSEISAETDILICGKYPDWMLIQQARITGVKIIFIDKASDLFDEMVTDIRRHTSEPDYSSQVPLGV